MPEFTLTKVVCPVEGPPIRTDSHLPGLLIMRVALNKQNTSKWVLYRVTNDEGEEVDWDSEIWVTCDICDNTFNYMVGSDDECRDCGRSLPDLVVFGA